MEKDVPFDWTEECQEAFETLKEALTSAPILSYPIQGNLFIVDCDASDNGIGAVLSQVQGEEEKIIGFFSRSLSKPEKNYCVTRKELLALIKGIKHFHHYLYGVHFLIRTDHGALRWLLNFEEPEGQIAQWLQL